MGLHAAHAMPVALVDERNTGSSQSSRHSVNALGLEEDSSGKKGERRTRDTPQ